MLLVEMGMLSAVIRHDGKANVWCRLWDLNDTEKIKANFMEMAGDYLNDDK